MEAVDLAWPQVSWLLHLKELVWIMTHAEIATNYCLTQNLLRTQTSEIDIDVEPIQLLMLNQISY